ncbi:MAG: DUF7510 family protein [Halorhabdus sp.]
MTAVDMDPSPPTADVEYRDEQTIITIEGRRDVAVIVRDDEHERIYLPPEDFDEPRHESAPFGATPYSPTPYQAAMSDAEQSELGATPYSPGLPEETEVTPYSPGDEPEVTPYTPPSERDDDSAEGDARDGDTPGAPADGILIVHPKPVTDVRIVH